MLAVAVASSRTLEVLDLEGTGLTNQSAQVREPAVTLQHHRHLKDTGLGVCRGLRTHTCLQPHAGVHTHPPCTQGGGSCPPLAVFLEEMRLEF